MRPESEHSEPIIALLGLGYTRGQIATELDLAPNTVRRVIRRECRRRGVNVEGLRRIALDEQAERA